MKSKYKTKKAKPRELTITVKHVAPSMISYFLTSDHSGEVFTFEAPFDQDVDLSQLIVGAQYHVKTAVNYRGSYLWTEVRLVRLPAGYKAPGDGPKPTDIVDEAFEF